MGLFEFLTEKNGCENNTEINRTAAIVITLCCIKTYTHLPFYPFFLDDFLTIIFSTMLTSIVICTEKQRMPFLPIEQGVWTTTKNIIINYIFYFHTNNFIFLKI